MWLMKVMRQGSELHGLASYINKYNELCFFRWGIVRQRKPGAEAGWGISLITVRFHGIGQEIKIRQSEPTKV